MGNKGDQDPPPWGARVVDRNSYGEDLERSDETVTRRRFIELSGTAGVEV